MPELSIIVPVYKKEPYLSKCIDSILSQVFTDFELILIDDGSPDRCGKICDKYAALDERIIVIHQNNQGVSAARNAGLRVAKGNYLAFVDADDWVLPDMYEKMIHEAKSSKSEIVACGIRVWSDEGVYLRDILQEQRFYDQKQLVEELFQTPDQLGGTCCNKVFRRDAVLDVFFPSDIHMCEDRMYLFQCYRRSRSCIKLSESYSQVTESVNSATRAHSVSPLFEIISSSRMMIKMAYQHSKSLGALATRRYIDDGIRYMRQIKSLKKETKERCTGRLIKLYCNLALTIISCYLGRKLPQAVLNGYTFALLQL